VIVGEDEALHATDFEIETVNWVSMEEPSRPLRAQVKIRHKHEPAAALVETLPGLGARIRFEEAQRAITPGQAAVLYDGEVVLGGGWIK